ncbi:hypothetical protein DFQ30_009741 [Apophysomyces sp. BC1015]|nr:hypothetical protein DFQ30_009741 [Apophysomyces sp. BC1015]KAG0171904.1 hypothetical protein DFQ29_008635 [Apophysomyces sp. BC1021]
MTTVTHQSNERTVKAANITGEANEEVIRNLFEILGPIKHLQLHESPYHDGAQEAIVEYQEHEAAMTALHLSGTELGDRILVISFSARIPEKQPQPEQKQQHHILYAYCASSKITRDDLHTFFRPCGSVNVQWQPSEDTSDGRWAVLDFASAQAADAAIHMNGQLINDKPKNLKKPKPLSQNEKNPVAVIPTKKAAPGAATIRITTTEETINEDTIHGNGTGAAHITTQEHIRPDDDHVPEIDSVGNAVGAREIITESDKF